MPRDARSRHAARGAAATIAGIAVAALAGWASDTGVLVRLFPAFPPLRLPAALGLLGIALGLEGVARGSMGRVVGGATVALVAALSVLFRADAVIK